MLKETRQLFKYVIKHPSKGWTVDGDNFCLLIPASSGVRLKIKLNHIGKYEVTRITGHGVMLCDQLTSRPDSWGRGEQLKKNQWDKDLELAKQVLAQAKASNVSTYKDDVDYITCNKIAKHAVEPERLDRSA